MPVFPRQPFSQLVLDELINREIERNLVTETRLGTGAVTTTKIQENAAQELIVAENTASGSLSASYGTWEQILQAEVIGDGFPAILNFSGGYSTVLSLSTGPSISLDVRVVVQDNAGATVDTVSGTVAFFSTSGTTFLYQPFYQVLLEDPLTLNDVYLVTIEARRNRDDSGDTLDITFTRRFILLQEVKR